MFDQTRSKALLVVIIRFMILRGEIIIRMEDNRVAVSRLDSLERNRIIKALCFAYACVITLYGLVNKGDNEDDRGTIVWK